MLIIVDYCWLMFLDKELHAFIFEGWKGNELGTCDSEDEKCKFLHKEGHCIRDCILFKEWLQKKRILGYWSKQRNRTIRA
jgi:hypothetical protein